MLNTCFYHYKRLYLSHLIYDFERFNEIVRGWQHPASTSFFDLSFLPADKKNVPLYSLTLYENMKKPGFILLLFLFSFAGISCEKFYEDGDEDRKEHEEWQNDETEKEDNEESNGFCTGDIVDVGTFCNTAIYTQVWVRGYIIGAATGANGKVEYDFESPFKYDTALLLADRPSVDEDTDVMSVCLTSCSKRIREKLNLSDHPENLYKLIKVFGFQEQYLKTAGIKKIDAYEFPAE